MPQKPSNPPTREIDEALLTNQQRLEDSLQTTNLHFTEQLGILHTKLDNQQQLMDSRD